MDRGRVVALLGLGLVAGAASLLGGGDAMPASAAAGPSRLSQTPTPEPTPEPTPSICCEVERRISLDLEGHLAAEGRVAPKGICARRVPVKVQRKGADGWRTVARVATERDGRFATPLADRGGRYRGVARPVGRGIDTFCLRAVSKVAAHRH